MELYSINIYVYPMENNHGLLRMLFKLAVALAIVICQPFSLSNANTIWEVLKSDGNTMEIMGLVPVDDGFILYGSQYMQIRLDNLSDQPLPLIAPTFKHQQLLLIKADKNQEITWHYTYPNLLDAYEVLSVAASNAEYIYVVYTDHVEQDRLINPVLAQIDPAGHKQWSKRIFSPKIDTPESKEQIANLDAIKLIATGDNNCMLLFVTRSLTDSSEQYRLHVNFYDQSGKLVTYKYLSTHLYGNMFVINTTDVQHYFVVMSNLSRDAALEAMLLKTPFVPEYNLLSINASGQLLNTVEIVLTLSNVWIKDVVSWHDDSLLVLGKRTNAWFNLIDSRGRQLYAYENTEVNNLNHITGEEFNAAAQTLSGELIVADREKIYLFDKKLKLDSSYNIKDVATDSYINSSLVKKLHGQINVQQILPLDKQQYLLFYQYGSQIIKIKTP